ncbi:MAG: hypothetical protein C0421_13515 [Hyphomonas sp.]|uniref:hypothetical protein n=1 Tax=Hyphomonas sp. TaxID=87 RepID=UPI0025BE8799|nr:hypothetical protein [Hyphomonas sp.]MBA4339847.1 hypothetical protein [Hyphomonas sp.]
MAEDPFFVGWNAEMPKPTRRQMLVAGAGLLAGAGALGLGLGAAAPSPGPGAWDQGKKVAVTGTIYPEPYTHLLTEDLGYGLRPVFLVGAGKDRINVRPALTFTGAAVTGTLIERGEHAMMAVDGIYPDPAPGRVRAGPEVDLGEAVLTGEILDAKCWFGAMRPGHGKTHKACAALCARGGLPLAFAETGRCAEGKAALLFLNARGNAFGPEIIPLVADPVMIRGRIVEVAGLRQVRAKFEDVVRL